MQWIDPAYCDIRLGFEVTAYVYVHLDHEGAAQAAPLS